MNIFGICVESSHKKGMGHLYRALNLIELIKSKNDKVIAFINNDKNSIRILEKKGKMFEEVELNDQDSGWETKLINKYKINIWINDRLDTHIQHSQNVKKNKVKLISFDDRGSGADIADINFGSLPFNFNYDLKGKKVLKGLKYLILNKEIDKFKRERKKVKQILISFGGSDTYGVTIKIVEILRKRKICAEIILGPCFAHLGELQEVLTEDYSVIKDVTSLIEQFNKYDLVITGGGITPFEANASGLPCIIVANEPFEIDNGLFLERIGCSVFAGYHENINQDIFAKKLDVQTMSMKGMDNIKTDGVENIYREIRLL
ncbi:MAG: glycosyl transferase [Candidatus Omnitrophota bacterium]|nr:glycosyl transferase [Candidatus Omnitrophota bacterium]